MKSFIFLLALVNLFFLPSGISAEEKKRATGATLYSLGARSSAPSAFRGYAVVSRATLNGTELKALLKAVAPLPGARSTSVPSGFKADYGLEILTAHGKFDLLMSTVSLGMVHYGLDQKSYRFETVGPKCRTTLVGLRKRKELKAPTT